MLDLLCLCFVCLKKELSGNIATVVRPKSPISVKQSEYTRTLFSRYTVHLISVSMPTHPIR